MEISSFAENPKSFLDQIEKLLTGSDSAVSASFLKAVDTVQSLIDSVSLELHDYRNQGTLNDLHSVMQLAMYRMEEDFRNLLERNSESVDPEWLFNPVANPSFGSITEQSSSHFALPSEDYGEGEEEVATSHSISNIKMLVDLVPVDIVSVLTQIAIRMVNSGYKTECCHAYIQIRKPMLEESLFRLGVVKVSIEDVQKFSWEILEAEIFKWMNAVKVSVGVLFPSEKKLCEQVYTTDLSSVSEQCFAEVARASMVQLLNFAEAVAICRRAPEKLPRILDMYEEVRDNLDDINSIFSGQCCENLRSEVSGVLQRLGEAARGTFAEFSNAVRKDPVRAPLVGGSVHPLTRYVMNYLRLLVCFASTLDEILSSKRIVDHIEQGSDQGSNYEDSINVHGICESPFSIQTCALMNVLEENLEAKSKLYKDSAQSFLFLMNNHQYIVHKVKSSDVRTLVSDDWLRKQMSKVRQSHNSYLRASWQKVLHCLRDEGLHSSGSFSSSSVSRSVLKERFRAFNTSFEEVVKSQQSWIVSDPKLCADLRISIIEMMLPAYRSFLGRYLKYIESERHSERYIKYKAEDLESILNDLFEEGSAPSVHHRGAPM